MKNGKDESTSPQLKASGRALGELLAGINTVCDGLDHRDPLHRLPALIKESFSASSDPDRAAVADIVDDFGLVDAITIALASYLANSASVLALRPSRELSDGEKAAGFTISQDYALMLASVTVALTLEAVARHRGDK